ncbi:spermidine synthase [Acetivibrio ethanolgignens]|uniref:Spermidine synthase n=1 Tax=Acetivibrio ethanolgignens TaxID=290052 RepID=A0A0V8QEV5_9FIRM|nr:fused MFS/spermidine synthase [Acetivibrio ethanolgignens]KSV58942.1 spermidine synthase [Acetivibrio ethanolgignens]
MIEKRPILKNKIYLYLTEFFAGMSVMAVELGASRLLAPYFSSSQIVWTIIIGTIMIAMALGNIYGGRSADRNPNPDRLYSRIVIAAIWIAAIPVVGKYIILGISAALIFTVNSNFLIIAGFAACMVIFVFPLFLLGTVTPSLVKFTVDNLDDNGRLVGNLNAANTIGSIIGTFVPTFISIPAVGTSITFLIFAGILLALSVIYFVSSKVHPRQMKKVPVGILLFIVCCVFGHNNSFAFWQQNLTYEGESIYNYLQVYENEREVVLSTNALFGVQSVYQKEKGLTGMYYDYAMAAPYMTGVKEKDELNVLILGNGTGTYATQCKRYFDNMNITGVELDQKITDLAVEYFELPEDVDVITYDGRAYLNVIEDKYDLIMVDAYQDITVPFQMSSVEFFRLVREHLTDDGVMIVNMNMRGTKEGNINQYLADTISKVFSEVYTVDVAASTNRELFASNNPDMLKYFENNLRLEENEELLAMMDRIEKELVAYEQGNYLMVDDKAPVELLGMKVIDELIKNEVEYYRNIYEEGGISALLEQL